MPIDQVKVPCLLPSGTLHSYWDLEDCRTEGDDCGDIIVFYDEQKFDDEYGAFDRCGGQGFDGFLDQAQLAYSSTGNAVHPDQGMTIRHMIEHDKSLVVPTVSYTLDEFIKTIYEDTVRNANKLDVLPSDLCAQVETGNYANLIWSCCGEPSCGSRHALIRDGKCEVMFEVSAGSLKYVTFFPFQIALNPIETRIAR